jgi:predicted nucleic acid-binding protein
MQFAIDTNPLLDWADGYEDIPECFEIIKKKRRDIVIFVPPTVLHELGHFYATNAKGLRGCAQKALELIRGEPLLKPINLVPVGHGIVEINAEKLRRHGFIDDDEINDSYVLAESGLLDCEVLLTSDRHLTDIDWKALSDVMKDFDGSVPLIYSPRDIVKRFGTQ